MTASVKYKLIDMAHNTVLKIMANNIRVLNPPKDSYMQT